MLASIVRPQIREAINRWMAASDNLAVDIIGDAVRAIEAGNWDQANEMLGKKINPTYNKSMTAYKELQVFVGERNAEQSKQLHDELATLNTIMVATILVAASALIFRRSRRNSIDHTNVNEEWSGGLAPATSADAKTPVGV